MKTNQDIFTLQKCLEFVQERNRSRSILSSLTMTYFIMGLQMRVNVATS